MKNLAIAGAFGGGAAFLVMLLFQAYVAPHVIPASLASNFPSTMQIQICDPTASPFVCATVDSSGNLNIKSH